MDIDDGQDVMIFFKWKIFCRTFDVSHISRDKVNMKLIRYYVIVYHFVMGKQMYQRRYKTNCELFADLKAFGKSWCVFLSFWTLVIMSGVFLPFVPVPFSSWLLPKF